MINTYKGKTICLLYVVFSFAISAIIVKIFTLPDSYEKIVLKVQLYSSLVAIVIYWWLKIKDNGKYFDASDFNTIKYYDDLYNEVEEAIRIHQKLSLEGRKIYVKEAKSYCEKKRD